MKFLKRLSIAMAVITASTLFFYKSPATFDNSFKKYFSIEKNFIKDDVATYDFEEHAEPLKENKSRAASIFNYNVLFNLIYKFAYEELNK